MHNHHQAKRLQSKDEEAEALASWLSLFSPLNMTLCSLVSCTVSIEVILVLLFHLCVCVCVCVCVCASGNHAVKFQRENTCCFSTCETETGSCRQRQAVADRGRLCVITVKDVSPKNLQILMRCMHPFSAITMEVDNAKEALHLSLSVLCCCCCLLFVVWFACCLCRRCDVSHCMQAAV